MAIGYGSLLWWNVGITSAGAKALHLHNNNNNNNNNNNVKSAASQCWYADDATGCGSLRDVKTWWDELMVSGPPLGYFPNPQKCWLIVKPEKERPVKEIFSKITINITTEGRKHLGEALGSRVVFFLKNMLTKKLGNGLHK